MNNAHTLRDKDDFIPINDLYRGFRRIHRSLDTAQRACPIIGVIPAVVDAFVNIGQLFAMGIYKMTAFYRYDSIRQPHYDLEAPKEENKQINQIALSAFKGLGYNLLNCITLGFSLPGVSLVRYLYEEDYIDIPSPLVEFGEWSLDPFGFIIDPPESDVDLSDSDLESDVL